MCSTTELRAPFREEAAIGIAGAPCQARRHGRVQIAPLHGIAQALKMIILQIWSDDLMRKALFLAILATLAACNTVQGVGRDIESVGRAGKEVMH